MGSYSPLGRGRLCCVPTASLAQLCIISLVHAAGGIPTGQGSRRSTFSKVERHRVHRPDIPIGLCMTRHTDPVLCHSCIPNRSPHTYLREGGGGVDCRISTTGIQRSSPGATLHQRPHPEHGPLGRRRRVCAEDPPVHPDSSLLNLSMIYARS